jgi:hypothetical protein
VTDDSALEFTKEFYKQLSEINKQTSKRMTIAEAIRETRVSLSKKRKSDPSRLAYILYAPPNFSVGFGLSQILPSNMEFSV